MKLILACSIALAAPLASVVPATAQDRPMREERIVFQRGATGAVRMGSIRGYQYVDYLINVRAGQVLTVRLTSRNIYTYFNLLEPGQRDVATHVGSSSGNRFEGVAAKSGDYRIRVYMMRVGARRNLVANFRLETIIARPVQPPGRPSHDALVPGTQFHATGTVVCTFGVGRTERCPFGVQREGPGKAMVTVTRPNGAKRVIFFEGGRATRYDRSQADDGGPLSATRHDDVSVVRIGNETYQIVDAIIDGG